MIGNPVWFEIESDNQELITIDIIVNGETIPLSGYPSEKGIAYRMDIDISSVLQSFFDTESSIPEDNLIISLPMVLFLVILYTSLIRLLIYSL